MSDFKVKLLQLWMFRFDAGSEYNGIWETIGIKNQGTDKERFLLRRAFLTKERQSFSDDWLNIPTSLLINYAKCVKFEEVYKGQKYE